MAEQKMSMKWWLLGFCLLVPSSWGHAQGALDRLEQQLRNETLDTGTRQDFEPGYLGVIADDRGEEGRGVRVIEVIPNGPAFASGLRGDDLITGITNRPVRSLADLARLLETQAAGSEMIFQIVRQGEPQELRVTLGQRPPVESDCSMSLALFQNQARVSRRREGPCWE